jgi:hypothetical protein
MLEEEKVFVKQIIFFKTVKGSATILEVSYSLVYEDKKKDEEKEKLIEELEELQETQQDYQNSIARLQVFFK